MFIIMKEHVTHCNGVALNKVVFGQQWGLQQRNKQY